MTQAEIITALDAPCPDCEGGTKPGPQPRFEGPFLTCPTCHGTGKLIDPELRKAMEGLMEQVDGFSERFSDQRRELCAETDEITRKRQVALNTGYKFARERDEARAKLAEAERERDRNLAERDKAEQERQDLIVALARAGLEPDNEAWRYVVKYAYADGGDGARAIQSITTHYSAMREHLRLAEADTKRLDWLGTRGREMTTNSEALDLFTETYRDPHPGDTWAVGVNREGWHRKGTLREAIDAAIRASPSSEVPK